MKLNLGCGDNYVDGFQNLDYSPNVILSRFKFIKLILFKLRILSEVHLKTWNKNIKFKDIRKLKYKKNSVTHIYSSHTLEHIFMWEARNVIDKCFEILVNGGTIRLALPDLDMFVDKYIQNRSGNLEAHIDFESSLLSYPLVKPTRIGYMINVFFKHVHKWHPTKIAITSMLSEAGFKNITEFRFREGNFIDLDKLENRDDYTFYIEATKISS